MIGTVVEEICINYSGVSKPLVVDDVRKDIAVVESRTFRSPAYILMWEHQWDWLTKDREDKYSFGPHSTGRTICGVPVRFA